MANRKQAVLGNTKQCTGCGEFKERQAFHRATACSSGLRSRCIECEKSNTHHHSRIRFRVFGINPDTYLKLIENQKNLCACCGQPEKRMRKGEVKRLAVDHNHQSGTIRGLICQDCNLGIGCFEDSSNRLLQAVLYLVSTDPTQQSAEMKSLCATIETHLGKPAKLQGDE